MLFVSNFPNPLGSGTISLLEYTVRAGNLLLVALTVVPLAIAIVLDLRSNRARLKPFVLTLTLAAIIGYSYAIAVFGDTGIYDQNLPEDIASVLQPVFFWIISPLYILVTVGSSLGALARLSRRDQHPGWVVKLRDTLFPRFSEINYVILFCCTALLLILEPTLLEEALGTDLRVLIFIGVSIYLFIRMLTKSKFGHDAKMWISFLYYAFLGWLSFASILTQLEHQDIGSNVLHQLNLVLMIAMLVVSITRFVTAAIIFRIDDGRIGKVMTERFSDVQHDWTEFLFVGASVVMAMFYLRSHYGGSETLLLLTFAYATFMHAVIFKRLPRLVLSLRKPGARYPLN
ncbi:hypothetical protein [Kribbella caucasensis]|uniref:hypothetical protein n=1 Tax=Kribbella caucasensis TaxID=2512215 RepID=UPI001060E66F|nr:hypothetical protein [Kribbella sp. VKM Ac-2527]